jgi:hypothetical protein
VNFTFNNGGRKCGLHFAVCRSSYIEKIKKNDDRDRDSDQPKQYAFHAVLHAGQLRNASANNWFPFIAAVETGVIRHDIQDKRQENSRWMRVVLRYAQQSH